MENLEFENYQNLKQQFTFKYKGFAMEHILAFFIWNLANAKRPPLRRLMFFFKSIDFTFLEDIEADYLMFSDDLRRDHSMTFNNISEKVVDRYKTINKSDGLTFLFHFSLVNIVNSIRLIFSNVSNLGFVYKLCAAGYLCFYINTINRLLSLKIKIPKRFVVYSAIHERQNLLVQYFRMRGSHVMGLSHGTNFIYKKNIQIDCINYENLDIDCLVWSQMVKEEYVKYGKKFDSLFVAGYPKKYNLKHIPQNGNVRKCIVLLSRKQFDSSNMRLINIISAYANECSFAIKLHPSLDYAKYYEICKKYNFQLIPQEILLTECMNSELYDFAIAVNTTSYYEIMIAGIPCLRFDDGDSYDLMNGIKEDSISSVAEFGNSLKWIKKCKESGEYENLRKHILEYNLGVGVDFYRKILLS